MTGAKRKSVAKRALGHPGCLLCQLPQNDPANLDLFEIGAQFYSTSFQDQRRRVIEARLAKDKRPEVRALTAEQVRNHFGRHVYPQPVPKLNRINRTLEQVAAELTERDLDVIRFIGQVRMVTVEQIASRFWLTTKEKNRLRVAQMQMRKLATRHLVYQVPRPKERGRAETRGRRPNAYFLGKGGAALLGDGARWPWIDHPDRVDHRFRHDLDVTDIFLNAADSWHKGELGGASYRVRLQLHNCWAAPHLDVAVRLKSFVTDSGNLIKGGERLVKPDGLLALSVELGQHSFLAPALIENDTGTQKQYAVAAQLANYDLVQRSGAIKKRFPQLDIEGYKVPVLVIAELSPTPLADATVETRIAGLRRSFAKELRERGYKGFDELPPILITSRQEWRERGVHAPVFDMRLPEQQPDDRRSAFAELVLASRPLVAAADLDASSLLQIDPNAALWHGPKVEGQRKSAAKAKAEQQKKQEISAEIEELRELARANVGGEG